MKFIIILIAVGLLSACGAASYLPSLQYCERLDYSRTGTQSKVYAECDIGR